MSEGFKKFKKKIFIEVLIKSLILSISIGLISLGIPLIINKIKEIKLDVYIYILIGIGSFLIVFAITFLILKPNKLRVAKRLDKQLQLDEKVQTMIEFENEDNIMVQIQRQDTNERLDKTPIKNFKMKFNFIWLIILVLGLGIGITSFVIPTKAEEAPPIDEPIDEDYDVTKIHLLKIREIIEKIKESNLKDNVKTSYIGLLEDLIKSLDVDDLKTSQMKTIVNDTILKLQTQLDIINTNNEVYTVLKGSDNSTINAMLNNIMSLNVTNVENSLVLIRYQLSTASTNPDDSNYISIVVADIQNNLSTKMYISGLDKEDALYIGLYNISYGLTACLKEYLVQTAIDQLFATYQPMVIEAIQTQADNADMATYIEESLIEIFALNETEEGNPTPDDPDVDDDEDDDKDDENDQSGNQTESGGLGTGDSIFGSDDEFYDPDEGVVEYGKVLDKYRAEIHQKFQEGLISQEYYDLFEAYFNTLYGITQEETNG